MDTSKLLGQTIIVLTGIIMAVAAAFFLLDEFVYPKKMADLEAPMPRAADIIPVDTAITGTISKVTVDDMATEQKAIVTIETASGDTKQVLLPADSRTECTKRPTITTEELQIGATVIVSGDESKAGVIEPCKNPSDDFTIKTS